MSKLLILNYFCIEKFCSQTQEKWKNNVFKPHLHILLFLTSGNFKQKQKLEKG